MDTITFENKEYAKELTISDLGRTKVLRDSDGKLKSVAPIEHYKFINTLTDKLTAAGHEPEIKSILFSRKEAMIDPDVDFESVGKIEAWIIPELIGRITINDVSDANSCMEIGIGYNKRGITLGVGAHIHLCRNLNIYGMSDFLSTYGGGKVPYEKMIELFGLWITEMHRKFTEHQELYERLSTITVPKIEIPKMIGMLNMKAIGQNYIKGFGYAPFNISEVNSLSQQLIKETMYFSENTEANEYSLWDLYNKGTAMITHSHKNIEEKMRFLAMFGEFFNKEYIQAIQN